eukprot:scaffold3340_cov255-Pinguiococcus_pyrenoidosus.AAC.2
MRARESKQIANGKKLRTVANQTRGELDSVEGVARVTNEYVILCISKRAVPRRTCRLGCVPKKSRKRFVSEV